jgi:FkbM family methyltransferase
MLNTMLSKLSSARVLRRVALPMLRRFNPGNIRIRHHYTGGRLLLHSFRHKGYWFHGRRREQATMQFFQQVLRPGDTVVEVGGHIGYLTMLFAQLVGAAGRVVVFEPGGNNLPYLHQNVRELPGVEIVEQAVSDQDGIATFFEEQLTGQNNSLLADYERFSQNRQLAFSNEAYQQRDVTTVRLDTFLEQRAMRPDLVKIDIEGAEFLALQGAIKMVREGRPILLIEVTCHANRVFQTLTSAGYVLFTPEGKRLGEGERLTGNVCALHPEKHRERMPNWLPLMLDRRSA